ncbi:hypothetical protein CDAR_532021 [Caerostris darwini]|uniref:Uncharacterized protein n=1 Tax=Caerostris darwini TaxID=1538125 RepID=A0AAV4R566_9ARAC|nr:hypothetical protein CDAR_532021 [Caerostris darwini]
MTYHYVKGHGSPRLIVSNVANRIFMSRKQISIHLHHQSFFRPSPSQARPAVMPYFVWHSVLIWQGPLWGAVYYDFVTLSAKSDPAPPRQNLTRLENLQARRLTS